MTWDCRPLRSCTASPGAWAEAAAFLVVSLAQIVPLWVVERLPLEDLPQHVAIVRILSDYDDPSLGFATYYEIHLGSTQHVAWYLAATALARVFGALAGVKILLSASVVALPWSARLLARAIGRDASQAWLCFGVVWNPLLLFGFVQYLAALPLMLAGLAIAARLRSDYSRPRMVLMGVVAVLCFFTHLVPFAFLVTGAVLLALRGDGVRAHSRRLCWVIVPLICAASWLPTTEAGRSVLHALGMGPAAQVGIGQASTPTFVPAGRAIAELHPWLADVLVGEADDVLFVGWALLIVISVITGTAGTLPSKRVGLLGTMAAAGYVFLPETYAWIWPISPRFAVLAALLFVVAIPFPRRGWRFVVVAGALALSTANVVGVARAFERFERDETGDFAEAIDRLPTGGRVAALFFETESANVRFWPYAHFIGYAQAERGGAVVFSFADHPSSPVRWRVQAERPATGPTGFRAHETRPEDLAWFDCVLTRGGPGPMATSQTFSPVYEGQRWAVWCRCDAGEPSRGFER